jgi:hypothetical protein
VASAKPARARVPAPAAVERPRCDASETLVEPDRAARPIGTFVAYRHHVGCEWQPFPVPVQVSIGSQGITVTSGPSRATAVLEPDRFAPRQVGSGGTTGTREQSHGVQIVMAALPHVVRYRYDEEHCQASVHCVLLTDARGAPLLSLRGNLRDPGTAPVGRGTTPAERDPPVGRCEMLPERGKLTTLRELGAAGTWTARRHYFGCRWRPLPVDAEVELGQRAQSSVRLVGDTRTVSLCVGSECEPGERQEVSPELVPVEAALRLATHAVFRGKCLVLTSVRTPLLELVPSGKETTC